MPAKSPASSSRRRTARQTPPRRRLDPIPPERMTAAQQALLADIAASRGPRYEQQGPFGVFLHAPAFGDLAQKLGAHCRYRSGLSPRLSEFVILVTARLWRAQYEWHAHAAIAEKAGVKPKTIADLRAGRAPKAAPADERALYAFTTELYRRKRVSEATYRRVQRLLGDAGTVELTGILGYYALVAMALNAFQMPLPAGETLPFKE